MSQAQQDEGEKSFDASPEKIRKAREKGDVPRSTDLSVAASYIGLVLAATAAGSGSIERFASGLMTFIDRPDDLGALFFDGPPSAPMGMLILGTGRAIWVWFALPAAAVLLAILSQRAFVVASEKIKPKLSRISPISNAKNKFGRAGLFEFFKSATKLCLYTVCVGLFLRARSDVLIGVVQSGPGIAIAQMGRLFVEFMLFVCLIAGALGAVDALWQHAEFQRKNRMTRKEVTDENKESEGDPHLKMARRRKGQDIALNQMLAKVPEADVIVVNPTHYAVALKWSRLPGSAPICVAKGVDEVALTIRRMAEENRVPVHSDPSTARALHATVELDQEIPEHLYRAVAVAIRFAEGMRKRAKHSL
ncbi:MAG: flagellar biosynthesis protein FlhB [Rhodobacteraceae bacterium]|nr:flagellar biosynthesis protein FlhB [Paracoccaceae bacterium]MAY46219.1 flagellar biosynthesis protein FlhB [Paracoccaceae bacterium]QEW22760.1 Flagellar biosynthetic protein FlhB [Marinibacterium anthonyi]|tara:strand:- start:757 stop:1845 length:1089 start_codon:yes stop_codon:yes gene_type:complete